MQLLNAKDAVLGLSFALKFYKVCQGANYIYIERERVDYMLCLISHLKNKSLHSTESNIWDHCANRPCGHDKYAPCPH